MPAVGVGMTDAEVAGDQLDRTLLVNEAAQANASQLASLER